MDASMALASPQPNPATAPQAPQTLTASGAPIELRVVTVAPEDKSESFGKKLLASGFVALLSGALVFATAERTGKIDSTVAECQIAKDILMDDQLNPALTDLQKRQVVSVALAEYRKCSND
jgi:hypothetical protein